MTPMSGMRRILHVLVGEHLALVDAFRGVAREEQMLLHRLLPGLGALRLRLQDAEDAVRVAH